MKIKISELNPNPFKNEINKGKLSEETISKIMANIKELGLMGALPVFKREGKCFLISGHHRLEALKREFGKNYEVEIILHDYTDEKVLRGMIIENLTQRSDELVEVTDNLAAIRKYLKSTCSAEQVKRKDIKGVQEIGSIRNIAEWLNKNGEVMSIGKIEGYLKVHDNLDRSLLKQAVRIDGARQEEDKLSIEEAKTLARLDKKEQKDMKKVLDETGLDYKHKSKLVSEYIKSPEEIKKKVLDKKINITDIAQINASNEFATKSAKLGLQKNYSLEEALMHSTKMRNILTSFENEIPELKRKHLKNLSVTELVIFLTFMKSWGTKVFAPLYKDIMNEIAMHDGKIKGGVFSFSEQIEGGSK